MARLTQHMHWRLRSMPENSTDLRVLLGGVRRRLSLHRPLLMSSLLCNGCSHSPPMGFLRLCIIT